MLIALDVCGMINVAGIGPNYIIQSVWKRISLDL
jgi:hypothetical protein